MTLPLATSLDRALGLLPRAYPGPGAAVAVLRDSEVLARHAWGWANAERRIAFTPQTLFRICSITKQFTCALVLDAFPDPSVLDAMAIAGSAASIETNRRQRCLLYRRMLSALGARWYASHRACWPLSPALTVKPAFITPSASVTASP